MPLSPRKKLLRRAQNEGLFNTSFDGMSALKEDYHYWTGRVTESSFQLSIGVIAANWAVFPSVSSALNSRWALISIGFAVGGLFANLIGAAWLGELHRRRIDYAENKRVEWGKEFQNSKGDSKKPWPYTVLIQRVARVFRHLKWMFPVAAGVFLGIAVCQVKLPSEPPGDSAVSSTSCCCASCATLSVSSCSLAFKTCP